MQPLPSLIRAPILFSPLVTILCGRFGALEADGASLYGARLGERQVS